MSKVDELNFYSLSELSELSEILEVLGLKLHAKNRIAGEECDVLWYLAETIRKAGLVSELASEADHYDDILNSFEHSEVRNDPDVMRFLSLLSAQATDRVV